MTATARKITRCACSTFEFGTFDPEAANDDTYTTGCKETTARTFAMGHDAKLVGFLVRAELGGEEIRTTEGGMAICHAGAVGAASKISEALAAKAQAQLDAARARVARKKLAEANKTARKSARRAAQVEVPAPTHRDAQIKVGRWPYSAKINLTDDKATYVNKSGVEVTTDKFTEIV